MQWSVALISSSLVSFALFVFLVKRKTLWLEDGPPFRHWINTFYQLQFAEMIFETQITEFQEVKMP